MNEVRKRIKDRLKDMGRDYAWLSGKIGKNHAYIQQYISRNVPRKLSEDTRKKIAKHLSLPEEVLGGPSTRVFTASNNNHESTIDVLLYDLHQLKDSTNLRNGGVARASWQFPIQYVHDEIGPDADLIMTCIVGDSMSPTLRAGEHVMVDISDKNINIPGVFALFDGNAVMIRRVENIPGSAPQEILLISDNEKHENHKVLVDKIKIAGRVVWAARRIN